MGLPGDSDDYLDEVSDPLEDGRSCVRPCQYCDDDLETEEPTQVIPLETMAEIQSGPTPAPRVVLTLRPGDELFEGCRCLVAAEAIGDYLEANGLVICRRGDHALLALDATAEALAIGFMALRATEALEDANRDEEESRD